MNLFENLQNLKENSDIAKLGKKIKQYKGWKIYKGISDYGDEIFRLFTPDEDRPEIGYEDWETDTLEQAISWVDNYSLDESYDYYNDESDYYDDNTYNSGDSELINRYTDIYNSEIKDLEEKLSFSEFCNKFDDDIKQSFDNITGEEDSYKKYPSGFNQHQTYSYEDYLNGTNYFEDDFYDDVEENINFKYENISLTDLQNAIGKSSFMDDRAYIKIDNEEYIKIGNNKWEYHSYLAHALPTTYTDEELLEIIRKSNDVKLYNADGSLVEDFEVTDTEQEYTSAKTSINSGKLPAIFKMINLKPGSVNLDFGGGRFDNVAEFYADKDVTNLVYDPYNRSSEHNKEVLNKIKENGGADSCTLSNVLNVIKEPEARKTCLQNCYNLLKSGGDMYITVYEGNGSGQDKATSSGYQLNKKTNDYLAEIQEVFPNAKRKGKLIYATK